MSEEEKQAIEVLKKLQFTLYNHHLGGQTEIDTILNLIEKQQKEILTLKENNKMLETLLQGNLYEIYKYYRELASSYQANSVSKDKIREKIKEIEEKDKKNKHFMSDGREEFVIETIAIPILKELLGEKL